MGVSTEEFGQKVVYAITAFYSLMGVSKFVSRDDIDKRTYRVLSTPLWEFLFCSMKP
jgi:hypothetical protein